VSPLASIANVLQHARGSNIVSPEQMGHHIGEEGEDEYGVAR
jgi:hypothetical protein